jgi:SNW domain-containing protein 1
MTTSSSTLRLPAPRNSISENSHNNKTNATTTPGATTTTAVFRSSSSSSVVPSYEERCDAAARASMQRRREDGGGSAVKLFVPRNLSDFDDGGAFPEIHVAQYPRNMGNPHHGKKPVVTATSHSSSSAGTTTSSRAIVNVQVDADGKVSYDAIVKSGTNVDKLVYSKRQDMQASTATDVALPTPEEEAAEAARTQAALEALLSQKTALDKPSGSAMIHAATSQSLEQKTQFIHYTPRPDAPGYNAAAAPQRIIQMVPAQIDPMMPPKHKHLKAPRGPAEDPVPVLHEPPPKLSAEEKAAWNIPACISNWKNTRGYTIPLDKRLAADGRGLIDREINATQFAALSESLLLAERQARAEVHVRANVQHKLAQLDAQERETQLRMLAQKARSERSQNKTNDDDSVEEDDDEDASLPESPKEPTNRASTNASVSSSSSSASVPSHKGKDPEDVVAARQREKLRVERKIQRERELRLEKLQATKKQKLEQDRDVSEKIALGIHATGTGGGTGNNDDDVVDTRLFHGGGAGMDSGFGREDEYDAYTKPLFAQQQLATSIYRPTRGETEDYLHNADEQYEKLKEGATSRFQPERGFSGAQGGGEHSAGPRTAPVQFEKAKDTSTIK